MFRAEGTVNADALRLGCVGRAGSNEERILVRAPKSEDAGPLAGVGGWGGSECTGSVVHAQDLGFSSAGHRESLESEQRMT